MQPPANRLRAAQTEVARVISEVNKGRSMKFDGLDAGKDPTTSNPPLFHYFGAAARRFKRFQPLDLLSLEDRRAQLELSGEYSAADMKAIERQFRVVERRAMENAPRGVVIVGARGIGKREAIDAALREYDPSLLLSPSSLLMKKKEKWKSDNNNTPENGEKKDSEIAKIDSDENTGKLIRMEHADFAHVMREEAGKCYRNRRELDFPDPTKFVLERFFGPVEMPRVDLLLLENFSLTTMVDAMLSRRIFRGIFGRGIGVVITSDRPPHHWYGEGLNREKMTPFLEEIKERCNVLRVEGNGNERFST